MTDNLVSTALVVGTDDSRGRTFFEQAWALIWKKFTQLAQDSNLPEKGPTDPERILDLTSTLDSVRKGATIVPVPLLVSDHAESPSRLLLEWSARTDLWGAILTTTSKNTRDVCGALRSTGTPILLTLDTTLAATEDHPDRPDGHQDIYMESITRLMPTNEQQATALIGALRGVLAANPPPPVHLIAQEDGGPYVNDMQAAFTTIWRDLDLPQFRDEKTTLTPLHPMAGEGSVIVYIGYAEKFNEYFCSPRASLRVYLTDGCYDQPIQSGIGAVRSKQGECLWARPITPPAQYAQDAYAAVFKLRRTVLRSPRSNPSERLEPKTHVLRRKLVEQSPTRYLFTEGADNHRGGYIVEHARP